MMLQHGPRDGRASAEGLQIEPQHATPTSPQKHKLTEAEAANAEHLLG
jgi:hypothetical protein